jgi:hypothetical protein
MNVPSILLLAPEAGATCASDSVAYCSIDIPDCPFQVTTHSAFLPPIYSVFTHSCIYGDSNGNITCNAVIWATALITSQDPRRQYQWIHVRRHDVVAVTGSSGRSEKNFE